MAGRGRGVAAYTFNIDALGIGRGNMPEVRIGPSPLFPSTEFKAVPLKGGEEEEYMLALKQELRGAMQRLPHNIKARSSKTEVEKYTERYLKQTQINSEDWTPDWNLFPKELMPQRKKRRIKKGTTTKTVKKLKEDKANMLSKLDELAKKDENPEKSDEETEKKAEEDEEIEQEEIDEEDIEEENDYIESYFDNGEDFAAESDDNMDGEATY